MVVRWWGCGSGVRLRALGLGLVGLSQDDLSFPYLFFVFKERLSVYRKIRDYNLSLLY